MSEPWQEQQQEPVSHPRGGRWLHPKGFRDPEGPGGALSSRRATMSRSLGAGPRPGREERAVPGVLRGAQPQGVPLPGGWWLHRNRDPQPRRAGTLGCVPAGQPKSSRPRPNHNPGPGKADARATPATPSLTWLSGCGRQPLQRRCGSWPSYRGLRLSLWAQRFCLRRSVRPVPAGTAQH